MKDLMGMMGKLKDMQSKMQNMQAEIAELEAEGVAGGGMVKVMLAGKGDMTALTIDPSVFKEDEAEILEDLILAAHNDAKAKLDAAIAQVKEAVAALEAVGRMGGIAYTRTAGATFERAKVVGGCKGCFRFSRVNHPEWRVRRRPQSWSTDTSLQHFRINNFQTCDASEPSIVIC